MFKVEKHYVENSHSSKYGVKTVGELTRKSCTQNHLTREIWNGIRYISRSLGQNTVVCNVLYARCANSISAVPICFVE